MIVSKIKNRLDSNINLHNDIVNNNMLLKDHLLQSANHVRITYAQRSKYNEVVRLARKSKIDN